MYLELTPTNKKEKNKKNKYKKIKHKCEIEDIATRAYWLMLERANKMKI